MIGPIDERDVRRSSKEAAARASEQDATAQEVVDDLRAQLAEAEE